MTATTAWERRRGRGVVASEHDTFGDALLDALAGREARVSVERDDGWRDEYDVGLYLNGAGAWAPAARRALQGLTGRVLDVGAGAGRHARFLAGRGCDVTALDSSPGAVEACRRGGVNAIAGAIGEPGLLDDEQFDAALLLGHNLGLLGAPDDASSLLRWLAKRCWSGAILIGDSLDTTIADESSWRGYNERNREGGRSPGQTRMRVGYGGRLGAWFDYWLISPPDLARAARGTGWRLERVQYDEDERYAGEYVASLRRA